MRKFKTAKSNRTNYTYYTATGEKITVTPTMADEAIIAFLHDSDDTIHDANRKEDYHVPVHYDGYSPVASDGNDDHNPLLRDTSEGVLDSIISSINEEECEDKLTKLKNAIANLKPEQQEIVKMKFYDNRTNVDIAREFGVSETAIRKRLKTIYKRIQENI